MLIFNFLSPLTLETVWALGSGGLGSTLKFNFARKQVCDPGEVTGPQYADEDVLRGLGAEPTQHGRGALPTVRARLEDAPWVTHYQRVSLLLQQGNTEGQWPITSFMEGEKTTLVGPSRLIEKKPTREDDGSALLVWLQIMKQCLREIGPGSPSIKKGGHCIDDFRG